MIDFASKGCVFSVPAMDYSLGEAQLYSKRAVGFVYGNFGFNLLPSIRFSKELSKVGFAEAKRYVGKLHSFGIQFSFLANHPKLMDIKSTEEVILAIGKLNLLGVDEIVIGDERAVPIFVEHFNGRVKGSVVLEISTVEKLKELGTLGVSSCVVDPRVNGNHSLISKMRSVMPVEVLVNQYCRYGCKLRRLHAKSFDNHYSGSVGRVRLISLWCSLEKIIEFGDLSGSGVVEPKLLSNYDNCSFKLAGRNYTKSWLYRALDSYYFGAYENIQEIVTGAVRVRNVWLFVVANWFPSVFLDFLFRYLTGVDMNGIGLKVSDLKVVSASLSGKNVNRKHLKMIVGKLEKYIASDYF